MNILIWIWETFCNLIDYLTLNQVTGKSWVKKDVPASLRSARPSAPEVTPELPFPGPIIKQKSVEDRKQWDPDLHMRKLAWAERQEWEEAVYEEIEELTQPGEFC